MRHPFTILLVATCIVATGMLASAADPPAWAYPRVPSDVRVDPDDGKPRSLPGTTRTYTLTEIRNFFAPPDWHDDHPPMPGIVGQGRPPMAFACGYATSSGIGKPRIQGRGLPVAYIKQQVADFKSAHARARLRASSARLDGGGSKQPLTRRLTSPRGTSRVAQPRGGTRSPKRRPCRRPRPRLDPGPGRQRQMEPLVSAHKRRWFRPHVIA